jgi:hypothetical protein
MLSSISKLLIEYCIPTERMAEKESSPVGVSDSLNILETVATVIFLDNLYRIFAFAEFNIERED